MLNTVTGLGVHMRASHPVEFNRRIDVEGINKRWTYKKLVVLAAAEREVIT